jgi:formyl-CoA transferase/CoA:oxalate CoA-transferase
MMLGDMGAEVIKVEEPRNGDDTRGWGPPFIDGESVYFLSVNRNKKSLTLDLKSSAGRDLARRLAARADILVENFRPGTMARLGLSYDELHRLNPHLVYCSITGFGQTGPEANRPGYDLVIQGEGGIMSLTGFPDGPPTKVGISFADLVAGLFAVQGILLALRNAETTGKGQQVDITLLDCQVSLLTFQAGIYFATGETPRRMGNDHPLITPYETFRTADGHINIAVGNDAQFRRFVEALGGAQLGSDDCFATASRRIENRRALKSLLEPIIAGKGTTEWLEVLRGAEVVCGPVKSVEEVAKAPQVLAREMIASIPHNRLGQVRVCGIPVKLSETPGELRLAPPTLGEHTEEILTGLLGLEASELEALRGQNVI